MKKKQALATHRVRVFYSGRVQGVGFRYTAERLALEAGVVGWVKNLPDGRVEFLCEGQKVVMERLLNAIKQSELGPYIKKVAQEWSEPTQEFKDFRVEFIL